MFNWLHRLADEGHRSNKVAIRWHTGHAIAYGVLIAGYLSMATWHLFAADRHRRAIEKLEERERGKEK